jgi:hypothetical protein
MELRRQVRSMWIRRMASLEIGRSGAGLGIRPQLFGVVCRACLADGLGEQLLGGVDES